MYIEQNRNISRPIRQRDISEIRRRIRIGDVIWTLTVNVRNANGELVKRKGVVIAKYPQFALVKLESGVRSSTKWAELIQSERKSAAADNTWSGTGAGEQDSECGAT